jgi:hypothetical protein
LDSDRQRSNSDAAISLASGVGEDRSNVFLGEFGEVCDDLGMRHSSGEPSLHIRYRYALTANTGPTASLPRLLCDDMLVSGAHRDLYHIDGLTTAGLGLRARNRKQWLQSPLKRDIERDRKNFLDVSRRSAIVRSERRLE